MANKLEPSSTQESDSHHRSKAFSLLLEFKNRRLAGEAISAEKFIAEKQVGDNSELVVDLIFAEFLHAQDNGDTNACERLCQQFPMHSKEIRRQVMFHQALTRPDTDSLSGNVDGISRQRAVETYSLDADNLAANTEPISDHAMSWAAIPGLQLLKPLGRGGMGIVYLAHQPKLNRKVAVKLLLGGVYASTLQRARFRAEAQAAASLRHPNIVQIDEVGEAQGQPYLVMEYVEGGTLEEFLKKHSPSPRDSAALVLTLARAIHAAHLGGIVHRDLKPGNIMLATRQATNDASIRSPIVDRVSLANCVPKITDFGMAKILGREQPGLAGSTLTMAGDLIGTPSYMAPEQAGGGVVGGWSDVYSLGAILYELLSGRPPFLASTPWATLEQVLNDEPQALSKSVPVDLRTICMTCLRKQPMSRYTSMDLVAADLERFLANKPISARRSSAWEQAWFWCKRNQVVAVLGATVFLSLLTIIAVSLWSRTQLALTLSENELLRQSEADSHARSLANLWDSLISQAQAQRSTGRVGQRTNSLASVTEAKGLLKQVGPTEERQAALLDTAAACLPLDDICKIADWKGPPVQPGNVSTDQAWKRVAQIVQSGQRLIVTEDFGAKKLVDLPADGASRVALSGDGRWLAAWGEECRVYDLQQSPPRVVGTYPSSGFWGFTPNCRWLVGASSGRTVVVDMQTHVVRHQIDVPGPTYPLAFANNDRNVAVLAADSLVVVDIDAGNKVAELDAPTAVHGELCLAWHPSSEYLAVAGYPKETVVVWEVQKKRKFRSVRQPGGEILIAFDGSGHRLITSSDWNAEVNVWDLASESVLLKSRARNFFIAANRGANTRMLVSTVGDACEVLEVRTQKVIQPFYSQSNAASQLFAAISPRGRWSAVATDKGIELYDNRKKSSIAELPIGRLEFNRLAFDVKDRLWACTKGAWLCWSFDQYGLLPPIKHESSSGFLPVGIDHNGSWSLTSDVHNVKLESLTTPYREIPLGESYDVRSASFSPDGRMVATGEWNGNSGVKVWSVADGKLLAELKVGALCDVQFSPDGKFLFTSPNGGEIWETSSWTKYHRLESNNSSAGGGLAFAFSPDSRFFANSQSNELIAIWDLREQRRLATLSDPEHNTTAMLAFSIDQSELYRISGDSPSAFKSWNLSELSTELRDMGIDSSSTLFNTSRTQDSSLLESESQLEFSVGSNEVMEDLVTRQLAVQALSAIEDNDWQTALDLHEEAFRRCPHAARVLNSFAWTLLVAPIEYRDNVRALEMASELVTLDDSRNSFNTLGTAQYRSGKFKDAIESLSKSLGDGTDATAAFDLYVLACCQTKLDQPKLAADLLAKGIESHNRHASTFSQVWLRELTLFRAEATELVEQAMAATEP